MKRRFFLCGLFFLAFAAHTFQVRRAAETHKEMGTRQLLTSFEFRGPSEKSPAERSADTETR